MKQKLEKSFYVFLSIMVLLSTTGTSIATAKEVITTSVVCLHSFKTVSAKPPTCTSDGFYAYQCLGSGYVVVTSCDSCVVQ